MRSLCLIGDRPCYKPKNVALASTEAVTSVIADVGSLWQLGFGLSNVNVVDEAS